MNVLRRCGLAMLALVLGGEAHAQAVYQPPRTAEGRPDMQGVWISRWITPLERQAGAKALAIAPEDVQALATAEWSRHNDIDPIEGTDPFEYSTFVVVRGEMRSSLIVDPPNGRLPFKEGGRAPARAPAALDGPEGRALNERCISSGNGFAPHVTAPSGNIRRIVQTPDNMVIHTELISQLRIVPLDGRTNLGARREKTRGWWEDDTLVVETTEIPDPMRGSRGSLFPVTRNTRITERFWLSGEGEITYTFTVEDPQLYAQAWTAETVMIRTADPMFEFACHEGNYGLANILRGARVVEERAARAARKKGKP
jgi:hypothetical protein